MHYYLVTAGTILFGHFLRSISLSKLTMVSNSTATIQERQLLTHLRYQRIGEIVRVNKTLKHFCLVFKQKSCIFAQASIYRMVSDAWMQLFSL